MKRGKRSADDQTSRKEDDSAGVLVEERTHSGREDSYWKTELWEENKS